MKKVMMIKVMMIALIFTACQQDDYRAVDEPVKEEPINVEKSVLKASFSLDGYGTYASTDDEDPESHEVTIKSPLELYVFSTEGPFYKHFFLDINGSSGNYTSGEFELPLGDWYMYAFVNIPNGLNLLPTESMNYMDFELQKINIAIGSMNFMGTLVREKKQYMEVVLRIIRNVSECKSDIYFQK